MHSSQIDKTAHVEPTLTRNARDRPAVLFSCIVYFVLNCNCFVHCFLFGTVKVLSCKPFFRIKRFVWSGFHCTAMHFLIYMYFYLFVEISFACVKSDKLLMWHEYLLCYSYSDSFWGLNFIQVQDFDYIQAINANSKQLLCITRWC